jgi:hypothetical protein
MGIKDKSVTQYVIDQAMIAGNEEIFMKTMNDDEAGFDLDLAANIFSTVTKMTPPEVLKSKRVPADPNQASAYDTFFEKVIQTATAAENNNPMKIQRRRMDSDDSNPDVITEKIPKKFPGLSSKFPGLSIPNVQNEEEIELDFEDEKPKDASNAEMGPKASLKKIKRKTADDDNTSASVKSDLAKPTKDHKHKKSYRSRSRSRDRTRDRDRSRNDKKKDSKRRDRSRSKDDKNHKTSRRRDSRSKDRDHKKSNFDSKAKGRRTRYSRSHSGDNRRNNRGRGSGRSYDEDRRIDIGKIYDGKVMKMYDKGVLVQ